MEIVVQYKIQHGRDDSRSDLERYRMRDLETVVLQLKLLAGARNPFATGESMRPNEAGPLTPLAISPEN